MASSKALLIAIVATFIAPMTMAEKIWVGDNAGWTLNFDYQKWAAGKEFHVGDTLVFRYPPGVHNVVKVNGTEFQWCAAQESAQILTTGNDVITLATPGKKWYICGVGRHCEAGGMKLAINVWPANSESPAPAPVAATLEKDLFGFLRGLFGSGGN